MTTHSHSISSDATSIGSTADASAAARAAHLEVDAPPHLLEDPLAVHLLGDSGASFLSFQRNFPAEPMLATARLWTTARSRVAEDHLAASAARQYVVLGAGLDTSTLRVAAPSGRVSYEVDLPRVQAAKRAALEAAGIALPAEVDLVPADLRDPDWPSALVAAGFDPAAPAFVACLGVTMYLAPAEVQALVQAIATLAPGSELVLDHVLPTGSRDRAGEEYARAVASMAAMVNEPWGFQATTDAMAAMLEAEGFVVDAAQDLADAVGPLLADRTDALHPVRVAGVARAHLPLHRADVKADAQ